MTEQNTPLWEVFIRSRNGLAHKHAGSVHAADADMALQAARDVYTRRGEGLSLWVVPSGANMGLDLLGQARSLYAHATETEGAGHDEDDLRDAPRFRNLLLVEQPNGGFAVTIVRQFLYAAYLDPWWRAMMASQDPTLAAISAKETAYHLRHAAEWLIRLGDGTAESHRRAQAALDQLWPYVGEMFEPGDEADLVASGVAADPAALRPVFDATAASVIHQATPRQPAGAWAQRGGRQGRHSEHLGLLLAEMQHLQRSYPGATW